MRPAEVVRTRVLGSGVPALAWLVVVWVALWEDVSVANVASGLVLGAVLLAVFPGRRRPRPVTAGRFRPLAALRLLGTFLVKLTEANAVVAWEVITPNNEGVNEGIVAVPITSASDTLVTLVANLISLTPGTLTLEVDRHPTVLYVHVLHLRSVAEVRAEVLRLERLVLRAFGSERAIEECEQRLREEVA